MRKATPVPSLVLPETHVLAYLTKWTLRVVFLLGVSLALAGQAAAAPEVFTVWGAFSSGDLSGTVTIDTATGNLLSADLIIMAGGMEGKFVFTDLVQISHTSEATAISFTGYNSALKSAASMRLTLQVSTLKGYNGGKIEGGTASRDASDWYSYSEGFLGSPYQLETGFLEPVGSPNPP
jgi:hypothetical protein